MKDMRQIGTRFDEAFAYAHRLQATQTRKGTPVPYIGHLMGVASIVLDDGGSEEEAIAALLHDAPEDQGGRARLWDVRRRFGARVAAIVDALTDTYEDPSPPWRLRKKRYLAHLADSPPSALRVSLADKLDNVRALARDYRLQGEKLWMRSGKPREAVRWYYDPLAERFARLRPGPLADEFSDAVEELDQLLGDGHGGRAEPVVSGGLHASAVHGRPLRRGQPLMEALPPP